MRVTGIGTKSIARNPDFREDFLVILHLWINRCLVPNEIQILTRTEDIIIVKGNVLQIQLSK